MIKLSKLLSVFAGITLLTVTTLTFAGPHGGYDRYNGHRGHNNGHYRGGSGWGWVAPLVISGVILHEVTKPSITTQSPIIVVQPQPVVTQLPLPPLGYHHEYLLDANCNCHKLVLVMD